MTRPRARAGFTIPELLIAAALGIFITGFGIQHTYEYFRLQGVLVAKTELRHSVQQAQDRIGQVLRYALYVIPVADQQYVLVLPQDRDRCGYVCYMDRFEVLWWQILPDPANKGRTYLAEKRVLTPAFEPPGDPKDVLDVFEVMPGVGRRVATSVTKFEIGQEAPGLYQTKVEVSRTIPRQPDPVTLAFQEFIAVRSKPRTQSVPKFDAVFKKLSNGKRILATPSARPPEGEK